MKAASAELRKISHDIEIFFDGSWSQRGFSASYGYGAVISKKNGKVLVYHVALKQSHECKVWDKKGPEHSSER